MLPSVTVIVPVRDGARTIMDCLDALQVQTYPNHLVEIIVVNNNSSDGTPDIVRQFPKIKLLEQVELQSSYASRNFGLAHANGEIITFTDADCIPAVNWLVELTAPFSDPEVLAVGGMVYNVNAENLVETFLCEINVLGNYNQARDQFLQPLITANAAFRKMTLKEMGGFNDRLYTGADIDLAWRLQLEHGNCVRYVQGAVVYHHHRAKLGAMFRQFRRHGFGEIFLDAIYHNHQRYPRTLSYQVSSIFRQFFALLKNVRSFVYRLIQYPFRRDRYYLVQPLLWFVAESGNLWGKLQALWTTQFLRKNPNMSQWQDPGG